MKIIPHILSFARIRLFVILACLVASISSAAQINTDQVLRVGQNALYFEDYMLSIQYFNRVIQAKPYLAKAYFFRSIAKLNLEDYRGAEEDATTAIEINPYLTDAWEVRGVARQNLGKDAEAIADYDKALELLPRNRQLLFNKALALQDVKDIEGADSTFRELLEYYPNFDSGYIGRARLNLEKKDTVAASADIDKALSINKNALNAYIIRADIAINRSQDFESALADMNEAVRLQPRLAGLYVNRAYLRYKLDDFFGAMADFDYALQLDPLNETALFNRSLLEMETAANDKALEDLNRIIELNPANTRAYYNRSIVNNAKGEYARAAQDISKVIEEVPDLPDPYFMRSQFYYAMNDMRNSERDYRKGEELMKKAQRANLPDYSAMTTEDEEPAKPDKNVTRSTDEAARRFASLLTIENNAEIQEEYNNSAIRGKVQNNNLHIEPSPWIELAYYASETELKPDTYYIKEVDDINQTGSLKYAIRVTPHMPQLDPAMSERHFQSIENYNKQIAANPSRAIDYIGRSMDYMTIHDYASAAEDAGRAIGLMPDLAVGFLLRAQANYHSWQTGIDKGLQSHALDIVLSDLNSTIEHSPDMAEAWYNKGIVHLALDDFTSALAAFSRAIELKPEMGEAWYNRGYVYLRLGNERLGISDLSRAGQLGILPAYNLIKRITQ